MNPIINQGFNDRIHRIDKNYIITFSKFIL